MSFKPFFTSFFKSFFKALFKGGLLLGLIALALFTVARRFRFPSQQRPVLSLESPSLPAARPVSPLFPPDHAAELLEGPKRDKWQKPQELVAALHLRPDEVVADIGAGSGYLMPYLSKAVGKQGLLYEEEIQEAYLPALHAKARSRDNVQVILGRADDSRLPRNSVNCFVLLTVYHEVEKPVTFLRTLRAIARPNARLAIIDFDAGIIGDPPAPEGHWISEQTVLAEARAAGWEPVEQPDFLRPASQFFLLFKPGKKD